MGGARGREEERTHKDARRSLTLKRTPARRNLPYYCIDTRGAGQDAAGTGVWHKAGKRSQDYSSKGKLQRRRGTYLTITSDDGGSSRSIFEAAAGQPTGQERRRRGVPDRHILCPSERHIPATPNIETLTATREVGRVPSRKVAIAERSQNIRLCGLNILNRREPHNIQNSAIDRRKAL
ncbi:uncharacterized protein LOC118418023 isoform X2 [Branchiostoma floridae]|uniref:Uncharacterized protein LOC118418023 isoform X2 n=1 Tax=Branchiostoma floridae TaxID=7739 RepID=A0A9J7LBF6_BRAFL|nr:uncharacterized protein LOC118418023 isoform X2 [Branchiostoma floridae]